MRAACAGDAPRLVALLADGSREPEREDRGAPDAYAAAVVRIRDSGGEVLVAQCDGDLVGVLQVLALEQLQHAGGRVAEVESLHVDARYRRRGVGSALLGAAVEWARARGCFRVQLTSHLSRLDAHAFYEQAGFVPSHMGYKLALEGGAGPQTA